MPELPEVETVRRGLQPVMEGALIEAVELRRPDLRFPFPHDFTTRLEGRRIVALGRRAKYLLVHLDTADVVLCHLGMSGSFRVDRDGDEASPGTFHHARAKAGKHDHAVFHLATADGGKRRVVYNDPRRFGFMLLHAEGTLDSHPLLSGLGVEPTGNVLDGMLLSDLLRGRRAPLKTVLMDQRLIAGLGNIYVCEALWRARLSPKRSADTVAGKSGTSVRSRRLAEAIRAVIADAIAAGGSSLRDYVQADGSLGYFQHTFNVYDREGEPCRREGCKGTIRRTVQAGRSTFHCSSCQR
ncbi:bifunctional DNA-formamidopyrimidine glycosylase/DNA-(apurinic or apyrimidinic site) lyase [Nitratireductor sp. ZSWI3]|uniref:bifunctional DNA-formamidopyrimidine glycosylase/DNA-(apurinic or apyrimidinic site) lyase n=1 Tax=Nitratireductor sp. ZSWI3 TaxID=2966359 RepID=UPI00214F8121|nr:bifunctional DNA-formamidopyrimidine glycosylase/DNA-(apurinic or apyrimidinic site) lyase [Nitratireductor sp. ZSWI3]MCR4268299.1 bifunctional DNA-formamidopyrimidine glycosylase/DNA-(apurinic or apyrimidinic site) lyase [Nitratireductor sp. ZSWI3]